MTGISPDNMDLYKTMLSTASLGAALVEGFSLFSVEYAAKRSAEMGIDAESYMKNMNAAEMTLMLNAFFDTYPATTGTYDAVGPNGGTVVPAPSEDASEQLKGSSE